jgi:NADH-quinone oxidoreductase subunit A
MGVALAVLTSFAVVLLLSLAFTFAVERSSQLPFDTPPTEPQKTPFLGGGAPTTHAWQRYHVRFYTMTLVFVAFEMEMMFMYPWAAVYVELGMKALMEMGMFLAILSLGIFYGWREGIFRWQ